MLNFYPVSPTCPNCGKMRSTENCGSKDHAMPIFERLTYIVVTPEKAITAIVGLGAFDTINKCPMISFTTNPSSLTAKKVNPLCVMLVKIDNGIYIVDYDPRDEEYPQTAETKKYLTEHPEWTSRVALREVQSKAEERDIINRFRPHDPQTGKVIR